MKKRYVYIVETIEVNVENGYLSNGRYYHTSREIIKEQHFFYLKKKADAYYSEIGGMNLLTINDNLYYFNRIRREEMR